MLVIDDAIEDTKIEEMKQEQKQFGYKVYLYCSIIEQ